MTALSVVIMCFGTMIPFMTYVSPLICLVIGSVLLDIFSKKGFVSWYFSVSILSILLCPDKEAVAVFWAFGSYPLFRIWLNKLPLKWIIKLIYFNTITILLYWFLLHVLGLQELTAEFSGVGTVIIIAMLLVGNVIFIVIDIILLRLEYKKSKFVRK